MAEGGVRSIGGTWIEDLVAQARARPRRRRHLNLHAGYDEPVQRFLNAVEPDSYVQPHRHGPEKGPETTFCLTGRAACVTFDDAGTIEGIYLLDPDAGQFGVEIAPGTWHMIVSLATGTVLLEIKQGPYDPDRAKSFAPWAPREGDDAVPDFLMFVDAAIRRAHPARPPDPPRC